MQFALPYGRGFETCEIVDKRIMGVLRSELDAYIPDAPEEELVRRALENPIGSLPLSELARGRERVTIISSDHTRPVPSRILMPALLAEIRRGNPGAKITILIATGCHRQTTKEELAANEVNHFVRTAQKNLSMTHN